MSLRLFLILALVCATQPLAQIATAAYEAAR
jgi:hypothetical protein